MESLRTKIEEALNTLVLYRRRRWQSSAQAELLCGSFRRLLHAFSGAGAAVFGVWRLKSFIRNGANIRYEFGLSGVRINCMPLPITVNDDCQLLGAGFERFHETSDAITFFIDPFVFDRRFELPGSFVSV
jgi:hypothetical protein